jgi:RNA 2',3'-cyclic 3'-phosphodiesterase
VKRLFFALWPDAATRSRAHALAQSLAAYGTPVAADNLHVTLAFLGQVAASAEQTLCERAATLAAGPLALEFGQLRYWQKPQILCLTAAQWPSGLDALAAQLRDAAGANGIAIDPRPYWPHITLLRKAKSLPPLPAIQPIAWRSDAFCLAQSLSTPQGVVYRVLQTWPLRQH